MRTILKSCQWRIQNSINTNGTEKKIDLDQFSSNHLESSNEILMDRMTRLTILCNVCLSIKATYQFEINPSIWESR